MVMPAANCQRHRAERGVHGRGELDRWIGRIAIGQDAVDRTAAAGIHQERATRCARQNAGIARRVGFDRSPGFERVKARAQRPQVAQIRRSVVSCPLDHPPDPFRQATKHSETPGSGL